MKQYTFSINIQANNQDDASLKFLSLNTLAEKLNQNELAKLAYIVKHDPIKTAIAKKALGV
jgi:hypothetical protein